VSFRSGEKWPNQADLLFLLVQQGEQKHLMYDDHVQDDFLGVKS